MAALNHNFTSPPTALPPSSSHASHSSARLLEQAPWYFPGASSKNRPKHERSRSERVAQTNHSQAVAPVLDTERRTKHWRAQSSVDVPTLSTSSFTRAPPLKRFKSYASAAEAMMATYNGSLYNGPVTPARKRAGTDSRPTSKLQDSPFSDYFTDDSRSPTAQNEHDGIVDHSEDALLSPETQHLLVRLNRLQAQLMRGERENETATINLVSQKINEIEEQLNSVHSQTRLPLELDDPGLFMEDDEEEGVEEERKPSDDTPTNGNALGIDAHDDRAATTSSLESPVTAENKQAENDYLMLKAQEVMENLAKLEQNNAELHAMKDYYAKQLEDKEQGNEKMQQERDALSTEVGSLKSDLAFDNTELLFLKLQFKALQIEVQASDEAAARLEQYAPDIRDDIQRVKRERVKEQMAQWEEDWENVDRKMKGRRRRHDVLTPDERQDSGMVDEKQKVGDEDEDDGLGEWQLQTVKKKRGRVQSLTITRVDQDDGETIEPDEATSESDTDGDEQSLPGEQENPVPNELKIVLGDPQNTEPINAIDDSGPEYSNSSTQTDSDSLGWLFGSGGSDDEGPPPTDDCAITTSSEDNDALSFSDDDSDYSGYEAKSAGPAGTLSASVSPVIKTAWQDLWEGLSSLAGMSEDRF